MLGFALEIIAYEIVCFAFLLIFIFILFVIIKIAERFEK